jgi:hypothetical protein
MHPTQSRFLCLWSCLPQTEALKGFQTIDCSSKIGVALNCLQVADVFQRVGGQRRLDSGGGQSVNRGACIFREPLDRHCKARAGEVSRTNAAPPVVYVERSSDDVSAEAFCSRQSLPFFLLVHFDFRDSEINVSSLWLRSFCASLCM